MATAATKDPPARREPPSPAATISSSGAAGVESARVEADKFESSSIQKAVEIVGELSGQPEVLVEKLLSELETSLDVCIGELTKEESSTTCWWRPIVPISDTFLSLVPPQGLPKAIEIISSRILTARQFLHGRVQARVDALPDKATEKEVKIASTGDSSFTLQVVMVLSRALDRLDSSVPQDWATRAKAAGYIEEILPMDLKALCHVYRTPFGEHWTKVDGSLVKEKDPDPSIVSDEEVEELWKVWERIWPGGTGQLSDKEKKAYIVDLMKARAFVSHIQHELREMTERPQETSGPFKTPSDVKQLTSELRSAVYSILHVTKPAAIGNPTLVKRAEVPAEFSVESARLPDLALVLTDYTVMRRIALHILIKAHSSCNRVWDCKRDTPDFRAQLQHRREIFHPVVDLRRMVHNVFGSNITSLADYLLRKESHWLAWKGIAVSKEVCGPFLHSTHRERFGTPWPPPTRLLAVEDHKENGSPSVVAVSPSPDEGTSPTPSVDVSINNKRKSAEEMSESPAHPPVKRARHAPGVPRHVERMLRMLHQAADASTRSPYAPSAESPSPSESSGDEASEEEVSQCDKYMDRVLQDDDPENGIEEEYRCYNNKIFQWQLRRMLARSHIECYYRRTPPASNDAAKEELINLVYKLKGKDKPNTTVTAAPEEEPPVAAAS